MTAQRDEDALSRAKLAGRLEAESTQLIRSERRKTVLRIIAGVGAAAAIALLLWQPWNSGQRQAQTASDAYYAAHTDLTRCTEHSNSTSVAVCWDTYSGALSAISWPPVLRSDSNDLINDINVVANALRGSGSYEAALGVEGNAENRLETDMGELLNGR